VKHTLNQEIVTYYYKSIYSKIWPANKSFFNPLALFERYLEFKSPKSSRNILEIGGGQGQHLNYVKSMPKNCYVILDPILPSSNYISTFTKKFPKVIFKKGLAEQIPFADGYFDHVKSTCVLAHVESPLLALLEIKRVTQLGGEVILLLPTDPGLLNLFVKKIYTYPKINKISKFPADLIYSIDHKNSIGNLLSQIRFVFRDDKISINYLPFIVRTTNLNLVCIVKILIVAKKFT